MFRTLFFKESFFLFIILTLICGVFCIFKQIRIWALAMYVFLIGALMIFYRVPNRTLNLSDQSTMGIVSPCDGVIKAIEVDGKNQRTKIVVFLNIFDQHLQYYPINGRIVEKIFTAGSFAPAYMLEKSKNNERMHVKLEGRKGIVGITQIAGQIARRIVNHAQVGGGPVKQGDYMGMIKLSSRVDIEFPSGSYVLNVKVGQRVRAKETLLAI